MGQRIRRLRDRVAVPLATAGQMFIEADPRFALLLAADDQTGRRASAALISSTAPTPSFALADEKTSLDQILTELPVALLDRSWYPLQDEAADISPTDLAFLTIDSEFWLTPPEGNDNFSTKPSD